jgi:23S rRNA-intervening sequence protein
MEIEKCKMKHPKERILKSDYWSLLFALAAPNYAEAWAAESKKDFIHKLAIVLKELRESTVWIRMIVKSELIPHPRLERLQNECDQLCKVIAKSLVTAKSNLSQPNRK